jgi:putative tryptophan/tyrosine transport system substrate-binding protein
MRRREVLAAFLGAAAAWPRGAGAQQTGTAPTIGFLGASTPSGQTQRTAAFVQRLRELGWIEGRTIAIDYRWAEGRAERAAEIAAEFVRLKVDLIFTSGTPAALAAKTATSAIPVVFAGVADPVGTGLVASLAHPSGNVTGFSIQAPDLAGKRLELLRELLPGLRRLAMLGNVGSPAAVLEMAEARTAADALGIEASTFEIRRAEDVAPAFDALSGTDALYIAMDPLIFTHRASVNALALAARLPTVHNLREGVETGGLMSYGPNFPDQFRRAADLADKILRGKKPGDIPVEQPNTFDLVINLKTAKALGLTIPANVLARADEVIE